MWDVSLHYSLHKSLSVTQWDFIYVCLWLNNNIYVVLFVLEIVSIFYPLISIIIIVADLQEEGKTRHRPSWPVEKMVAERSDLYFMFLAHSLSEFSAIYCIIAVFSKMLPAENHNTTIQMKKFVLMNHHIVVLVTWLCDVSGSAN